MTLAEVRQLFPAAKYNPKPDCRHCGGTGINRKASEIAKRQNLLKKEPQPCICIFIDHQFSDDARKLLAEAAKKLLGKKK